jgi:hypothetical protein
MQVSLTTLDDIRLTSRSSPLGRTAQPAESRISHAVLQSRCELVSSHSSLPAVVQGVNCLGVSDWIGSLQSCLAGTLLLVALGSIIIATIACSNGVQLVTIAGPCRPLQPGASCCRYHGCPQRQLHSQVVWAGHGFCRRLEGFVCSSVTCC